MKKMKVLLKMLMIFMVITTLATSVFGYNGWSGKISTLDGKEGFTSVNDSASNVVGGIIAVTRIIAVGVAIIMLLVLAMKYIMAAPGDRADIKKHAVVYVVGAIVLFAGTGILTIIESFARNIKMS